MPNEVIKSDEIYFSADDPFNCINCPLTEGDGEYLDKCDYNTFNKCPFRNVSFQTTSNKPDHIIPKICEMCPDVKDCGDVQPFSSDCIYEDLGLDTD